MTNTNSYDCSYEKPLLEGIMDILRFMDGWTKKIADRNIKVIQQRAITGVKSLMISRVFVTDLDGDDFVTFFIKVIHSKDTPAKKFHVNNTNATKFATFQISN